LLLKITLSYLAMEYLDFRDGDNARNVSKGRMVDRTPAAVGLEGVVHLNQGIFR